MNEANQPTNEWTMPKPNFPSMDLPPIPNVEHNKEAVQPSCDGEPSSVTLDVANSPVPPPKDGKARIMIGIPLLDIKYEFFESFLKFWTMLITSPRDYEILYHVAYRKPVHMAEEYLVNTALYNKCTHILLMDDDIYDITPEDIEKLYRADKDFISGVMHASKFPHAMCVFRRYDTSKKVIDMPADNSMYRLYEVPCTCFKCGHAQTHWDVKFCPVCGQTLDLLIQEADLTPFPFTLIKTSVFSKIKKPWFHCTNGYPTDSWFADRLLEAGLKEYAHMGVRLNHAGVTDETKPYYVQMGMQKAQKQKAVVHLPPEDMDKHQYLLNKKMKETEESLKAKPLVIANGVQVANLDQGRDLTLVTHGT